MPKPYNNNFNPNSGMSNSKNLIYCDENDFIKKLRSLKTYCPQSYKDFIFNVSKENYFELEDGRYLRDVFTTNEFKLIYGQIRFIYSIKNKTIIIEDLEPSQFLLDGYMTKLKTYKSMFYRDNKDKFKIDLMVSLKECNRKGIIL